MTQCTEPESLDSLLVQVCRLHYLRAHELLEGIGLYRGQPPVLRALWEQEGMTHTELAERLQVTPATVTRMLQRMERAGFVTRRPDEVDQRISRVYLTATGRAIRADLQRFAQIMEEEAFEGLTEEQRLCLRQCLLRIRTNLQEALGKERLP